LLNDLNFTANSRWYLKMATVSVPNVVTMPVCKHGSLHSKTTWL
jgi:hypothetical protein